MRHHLTWIGLLLLLAAGLTTEPRRALAWGQFGHLTVCDLAYRNLTPHAREVLKGLFHSKTGGITVQSREGMPLRHYTAFNVGCLEEDERPRKHPDDHFLNLDRSARSIDAESCPTAATCIFAGIERDLAKLKDTSLSDEERVFALMAVGHWIGDIHQPLHISFADDRGGNYIAVKLKGKCGTSSYRPDNLHAVWDGCLLEAGLFEKVRSRADYKTSWGKRTITYRAVDTLMANTTLAEETQFVSSSLASWANESYQITLGPDTLYCTMVGAVCQYAPDRATLPDESQQRTIALDQDYLKAFAPVAQERVRKAGFRLAHLINQALDPDYTAPTRSDAQPKD